MKVEISKLRNELQSCNAVQLELLKYIQNLHACLEHQLKPSSEKLHNISKEVSVWVKGVLNPNFRPFILELKEKLNFFK